MVNNRKRTSNRNSWSEHSMRLAIAAVKAKKMVYLKASQEYKVPKSTLERRVKSKNKLAND